MSTPLVDYADEPINQPAPEEPPHPTHTPVIVRAKANENTGITKLNDHLTDTNYNTWKGQMMLTLEICDIEKLEKLGLQ